jgi:hypothetical protein
MIHARTRFATVTAGLLGLLLVAGCLSDNPGSNSLAYVDINSGSESAIRKEIVRVFEDDGYTLSESGGDMMFERVGTQRDQVLYKHYGDDRLVMRVAVSIEPRRQGGYLIRAEAFAVRDGREDALTRMSRRPYQNQLNRVKASLIASGGPFEETR